MATRIGMMFLLLVMVMSINTAFADGLSFYMIRGKGAQNLLNKMQSFQNQRVRGVEYTPSSFQAQRP